MCISLSTCTGNKFYLHVDPSIGKLVTTNESRGGIIDFWYRKPGYWDHLSISNVTFKTSKNVFLLWRLSKYTSTCTMNMHLNAMLFLSQNAKPKSWKLFLYLHLTCFEMHINSENFIKLPVSVYDRLSTF